MFNSFSLVERVNWALRSTWAQINGQPEKEKAAENGFTVH
jgi:hypothetical protein